MSTVHFRRDEILQLLKINRFLTIPEICKNVFASPATIRRDLVILEKQGSIKRTRGGAVYVNDPTEMPFEYRENVNIAAKDAIAEAAAALIKNEQFIFLDSSTTCIRLARKIVKNKNLKILTNGTKTADILCKNTDNEVLSTGGKISGNTLSMLGNDANTTVSNYYADLVFLSGRSLTEAGVLDAKVEEANIKQLFSKNSAIHIVLIDSEKYNKSFYNISLPFEQIDYLITDKPLPLSLQKVAQKHSVITIDASQNSA